MNGKHGSIKNFSSLSGVSATDLNDTMGTGIRYWREVGMSCVKAFEEHTVTGSPSTKAPRLQQAPNEQVHTEAGERRGKEGEIVFLFLLPISQ